MKVVLCLSVVLFASVALGAPDIQARVDTLPKTIFTKPESREDPEPAFTHEPEPRVTNDPPGPDAAISQEGPLPVGTLTPEEEELMTTLPGPMPDQLVPTPVPVYVMVNAVEVPEEKISASACPSGPPFGKCSKDTECPMLFGCTQDKVCCLAISFEDMGPEEPSMPEPPMPIDEAILEQPEPADIVEVPYCPPDYMAMKNAYCSQDKDCRGNGTCMLPSIPAEAGRHKIGICCTDQDFVPDVVRSCPKDMTAVITAPCGLGMSECPAGSSCFSAGEMYGRCCGAPETEAKTDQADAFHRGGFKGFGHGRGFGHGFGHGFGGHRHFGHGFGGFGGHRGFHGGHFGHRRHFRPFGFGHHRFHGHGFGRGHGGFGRSFAFGFGFRRPFFGGFGGFGGFRPFGFGGFGFPRFGGFGFRRFGFFG